MKKLKKNDEVVVLAGRDKGKKGVIKARLNDDYAVVGGINKVTHHQKPNPLKNQQGGMVEKEMPIHISNLAIFNAGTQKADRVQIKTLENGKKTRIYASNGEMIEASAT